MERLELNIDGMNCDHCVRSVTKALGALDGVHVERVAIGSATLTCEPEKTSVADIRHALAEAGYEAERAGERTARSP